MSADSFRGDAFPLGTGYNSNQDRSAEEADSESDDGFVVKSSSPAPRRPRQPIIISDGAESSASEGEIEVISRPRSKSGKKPRIVEVDEDEADEDEPVVNKSRNESRRAAAKIVEIESDVEDEDDGSLASDEADRGDEEEHSEKSGSEED